jgi:RNA polymerase sigma factor (sigma-70 family)
VLTGRVGPEGSSSKFRPDPTDRLPRASSRWKERGIDDTTLRTFLERDYPRVVNAVAMLGVGYAQAEDAVQEALVRAWIRSDRGETIDRLDAWVTVAAWNLTRSGLRRLGAERRAREQLTAVAMTGDPAPDAAIDLMRALARLPRRLREVAVLRYRLELTTRETAHVLGIAEGTVKRALADARRGLVSALAVPDEEVAPDGSDR